ncbi:MAG: hypothetical protein LBP59_00410 [Planctomycetaceae bacterium]|nr:hypothetical protein [Planctomycetaceae bacterium]
MSEVLISTALSVAYRQSAGETPAIRRSRLHFRIAGISPEFLQIRRRDARDPAVSPAFQDRGRLACVHSQFFVTKNQFVLFTRTTLKNIQRDYNLNTY